MGVRGLWEVVGPSARPVALESLRDQRLAIDASIWIYQFMKAVRDNEGNAMKSAHVIGFFRRISKLLFFDIKPVFVFDGDAPVLKRTTLRKRNERRQGRREDAARTAAKLLTIQLQRAAEEASNNAKLKGKQKEQASTGEDIPDDVVYYGELNEPAETRATHKPFRPTDQYHLPDITTKAVIATDDPRLLTEEEMAEYAQIFQEQARSGIIDSSLIDFDSPEFKALPLTTQYQLLNTARLKSRYRMGYTAEQLDEMFRDRMEFSKFQIHRVAQRNYLTQTLMDLAGMGSDLTKRVAGEKGGEYVLNKNEGGWTLALETGRKQGVVKLDEDGVEDNDSEDDVEFEDVPLDGMATQKPPVHPTGLPAVLSSFEDVAQREQLYKQLKEEDDKRLDEELFGTDESRQPQERRKRMTRTEEEKLNSEFRKHFGGASILFGDVGTNDPAAESSDAAIKPKAQAGSEVAKAHQEAKAPIELPPWFSGPGQEQSEIALVEREDTEPPPFGKHGNREHGEPSAASSDVEVIGSPSDSDIVEIVPQTKPVELEAMRPKSGENSSMERKDSIHQALPGTTSTTATLVSGTNVEDSARISETEKPAPSITITNTNDMEHSSLPKDWVTPGASETSASQATMAGGVEPPKASESAEAVPRVLAPAASLISEAASKQSEPPEISELDKELAEEDARHDEEEEEELVQNIMQEIEEHERFARELNSGNLPERREQEFQQELQQLRVRHHKEVRDADNPTREMIQECQELLRLFGIPYVTAPREAEAQCATLMELGLVDGIITDDSDCFLFGGKLVYKNVFNRAKYVEAYSLESISDDLGLDRGQLIRLAQLLGSDYTDGLPGVGPVTALELLAQFPGDDGLERFRDWWHKVQALDPEADTSSTPFLRKFKRNAKKLFLPESFPDKSVEDAYLNPEVDKDTTNFEWGAPNMDALRAFLTASTGWTRDKVSELLVPVIQDMNRRQALLRKTEAAQSTLTNFLSARNKIKITGSKRVRDAVSTIVSQADARKKRKS